MVLERWADLFPFELLYHSNIPGFFHPAGSLPAALPWAKKAFSSELLYRSIAYFSGIYSTQQVHFLPHFRSIFHLFVTLAALTQRHCKLYRGYTQLRRLRQLGRSKGQLMDLFPDTIRHLRQLRHWFFHSISRINLANQFNASITLNLQIFSPRLMFNTLVRK